MGYENDPYRDEDGEPLMDFDDGFQSDHGDDDVSNQNQHNQHLIDDNLEDEIEEDDWNKEPPPPPPVYNESDSKARPRKRLIKKSTAVEQPVPDFPVDDDVEDDDVPTFVRDDSDSGGGGKRKKFSSGGGSASGSGKKKEKKSSFSKFTDKGGGRSSGGEKSGGKFKGNGSKRSGRSGDDAEVKEMWDTVTGGADSEDDKEGPRMADDDNFIDDTGVDPADRYGSDHGGYSPSRAPQAEEGEDDEVNDLFKMGKKKKTEKSGAEIALLVENVIAELEVAAEEDAELNQNSKPAITKLKKLPLLIEVLSKKQLQLEFLDHGVLNLLKKWLEPLPDGSLPNINIRAAILKILTEFPIDLDQYDRREQLKKSGLGKVIMFLSKSDEETTSNRKIAKELVDKWSRPIFNKSTRFEDMQNFEEERTPIRRPSMKKPMNKASGMQSRDDDLDLADKNKSVGSEEAFKLVNEAFKEVEGMGEVVALETFWTACAVCRLLHQFERRYLGHNLMCPNCKKSFKAVEVGDDGKEVERNEEEDDDEDWILSRCNSKRKMSSVGDVMKRSEKVNKVEGSGNEGVSKRSRVVSGRVRSSERLKGKGKVMNGDEEEEMTLAEMQKFGKNDVDNDEEGEGDMMTLAEMKKLSKTNVSDDDDEVMTLAEMQKVVKKNVNDVNLKVRFKVNEKDKVPKRGSRSRKSKNKTSEETENQDVDIMTVEDSDFYDFDKLRVEQSFKKGQVWALYDDDDGMPRTYGLINEVVSRHPFEVDMSWLDPQTNTEEELLSLERTGFHISCGRFKVAGKTLVESLNVFSHNVDCERAAKEVYRIYPKKGSVWALYSENRERENELAGGDKRRFDIVVFLTSYSEVHGLSMGYLEKVNGFKTIFRRREIGCHAIKWLEKHEVGLFSHQIPARKLSREEVPDISGDCWELDPASLPTQVVTTR